MVAKFTPLGVTPKDTPAGAFAAVNGWSELEELRPDVPKSAIT